MNQLFYNTAGGNAHQNSGEKKKIFQSDSPTLSACAIGFCARLRKLNLVVWLDLLC